MLETVYRRESEVTIIRCTVQRQTRRSQTESEKEMSIHTLQDYIQRVNNLRRQGEAPHKPFLLLIIIEMLESGELSENRISFREIEEKKPFFPELMAVFNSGNTTNWQPSLHNPFFI